MGLFSTISRNVLGSIDVIVLTGAATGALLQIIIFTALLWILLFTLIGGMAMALVVYSRSLKTAGSLHHDFNGIGVGAIYMPLMGYCW